MTTKEKGASVNGSILPSVGPFVILTKNQHDWSAGNRSGKAKTMNTHKKRTPANSSSTLLYQIGDKGREYACRNGKTRWLRSNGQNCFHCHAMTTALDDERGDGRLCTGMETGCIGLQET